MITVAACVLSALLLGQFEGKTSEWKISKSLASRPWVKEDLDYVPGRMGDGLRFDWWRLKLFYKAPGYFNPQAGTIQFWIAPVCDVKDLQDYAIVLQAAPTRAEHQYGAMGVTLLPDHDARCVGSNALSVYIKSAKPGQVQVKNLSWKKEEWHAVAITWGARGLCVYIDGALAGRDAGKGGVEFSEVPDLLSFGGGLMTRYSMSAQSRMDEIEISDCERSEEAIRAFAQATTPPVADEHTLALHHGDVKSGQVWMTSGVRGLKPYAVSGSEFLGGQRIFETGKSVDLPVTLVNSTAQDKTFSVAADITDFYGERQPGAEMNVVVPAGAVQEAGLMSEIKTPGWYRYTLTVSIDKKEIYRRQESFVILPERAFGWASPDNYIGHHLSAIRSSDVFTKAGIPWERDMEVAKWPTVEPEKGRWDWRAADEVVAGAKDNLQELVLTLGYTPRWAGKVSDDRAKWKNQSLTYRSYTYPPADMKEFAAYVREVVTRYKGRVKYWEIWNEPDWNQPEQVGLGFMGSNAQYREVLKTGYETIKSVDPQAVVLSGGFVPHAHLIDYLVQNGGTAYFDILGMHRYRSWDDYMRFAKQVKKPYWQTEKQLFKPEEIGPELQLARQNGVGKYFLFDASKSCFNEYDWCPTPFYFACAQAAQKIGVRPWTRLLAFSGYENMMGGSLYDEGKPGQLAALVAFYQGSDELKVSFTVPTGKSVTVTDYMGAVTKLTGVAGERLRTRVGPMTFIEGPFDVASLRVEPLAERSLLRNGDFALLDGDMGIDGPEGMKPREWRLWPEAGAITLARGEDGNAVRLAATGKGLLRLSQFPDAGHTGFYRVSAEFKAEGDEPVMAYISVYDRDTAKDIAVKTWSNIEASRYKRCELVVPIGEKNRRLSVNIGLGGGRGKLLVRRVEMLSTVDPAIAARTTFIDLKPYANQSLSDDKEGDGRGGWADLGGANFAFFKTGQRLFGESLFDVIAGDVKTTPAAIILGSAKNSTLPRAVEKIRVDGKFKQLHFLHTAMFVDVPKGQKLGAFVVTYANGQRETIPLVRGQNVDDWYAPGIDPAVKVAEEIVAPNQLHYAVFTLVWTNPHPEQVIERLDFVSEGKALLALLAVSGVNP